MEFIIIAPEGDNCWKVEYDPKEHCLEEVYNCGFCPRTKQNEYSEVVWPGLLWIHANGLKTLEDYLLEECDRQYADIEIDEAELAIDLERERSKEDVK
jgi:hypothetical protein